MGGHVEMTTRPGRDYPIGARFQPDEAPLPMTVTQLVRDAARSVPRRPGRHRFDDFISYNGACRLALSLQLVRALGARLPAPLPRP
jgi:hypothetical protein